VPARRRRRRLPTPSFLALSLAGLAGLLGVNTLTAQDSFRMQQLSDHSESLAHEEQHLHQELMQAQSPFELAQRAARLGLRQAGEPKFLHLPTGSTR
jgi:hypothetical protein